MSEEHGYQRSGKKCREKFENLYKYYKKTKEGKAGRQDGKHYRFFRQLEALYGDNNTSHPISSSVSETQFMGNNFQFHNTNDNINHVRQPNLGPFQAPKLCDSLTLSNSSEMGTSSSDDEIDTNEALLTENDSDEKKKNKKRRGRRSWKAKIRDFIDSQMRKIMEKQEEWLERMMKTLESKEQERISRDEEWRNQEAARIERDRKFWANERAWMEARDSALMEALKKLIRGKEARNSSPENENKSGTITNASDGWSECEVTKLMELRSSADSSRFQESGCSEEALWEEIAAKMGCLGYNRSALVCKEKWDRISNYLRKTNRKGGEDLKSRSHFHHNNESVYNQGGGAYYWDINEHGAETEISTRSVAPIDSCFRLLVGADGGGDGNVNLWENYGMKLSKE